MRPFEDLTTAFWSGKKDFVEKKREL